MRVPSLTIVAGRKGVGKTYTTMQIVRQYVMGTPYAKPKKVLIFDVNNEYSEVKSMPLKYVKLFAAQKKAQVRRILPFTQDGKVISPDGLKEMLAFILDNYSNGLLLIEDINTYVHDNYGKDLIGLLTRQRHRNMDVVIHFQGVGRLLNPKLIQQSTFVRLHPTIDNIKHYRDRAEDYYEVLAIAEKLVDYINEFLPAEKQFFYCYVNMPLTRIIGKFNREEFRVAVERYLRSNNEALKEMINAKGDDGKPLYNYKQAYQKTINNLIENYYGNKT